MLVGILFFAVRAYPAEKHFNCKPAKEIMKEEFTDGHAWLATAIAYPGMVVQVYINLSNGDWTLVGVDGDLNSCRLLEGHDWQFALARQI